MFERAVFIVGGGQPARMALKTGGVNGPELAVEATRRHAVQLGTTMCQLGMPIRGEIPTNVQELKQAISDAEFGVVAGGLELGQTTDAVAMSAAQILNDQGYEVSIIVLSNIGAIYTGDPKTVAHVRQIKQTSVDWLVEEGILINAPQFFKDGMKVPLDPIAVARYQEISQHPLYFTGVNNTAGVNQFLTTGQASNGTLISQGVETRFYL